MHDPPPAGSAASTAADRDGRPVLSDRELTALRLLAEGRSTAQIATAMSISPNTVRDRIHHLRAKLDATDRDQAVSRARELGLL
ncbi:MULTISPECIES: response regulator transcription factor [unclassified Blastococcus]